MGRSSKNNDLPGDTAQKIDKIQNRAKNVKKRQKTREIEIQYIYIYREIPFLGDIQTSAPDDGRSFLARVLRLPGRNQYKTQKQNTIYKLPNKDLAIVNRVPFVSCCTYQWAKDKT